MIREHLMPSEKRIDKTLAWLDRLSKLPHLDWKEKALFFAIHQMLRRGDDLIPADFYTTAQAKISCSSCEAKNVKLWRSYQSSQDTTLCAACLAYKEGMRLDEIQKKLDTGEDSVRWWVPFIPAPDAFAWGYSSVPPEGVGWWKDLPLTITPTEPTRIARRT